MANPLQKCEYILQDLYYGANPLEPGAPCESEDPEQDYEECIDECGEFTLLPEVDNQRNRDIRTIGPYDPRRQYLCVGPGLNIQAKCLNQSCPQAFEKKVWIHQKFGIFRINELKFHLSCPVCKVNIKHETLSNIGFTKTKVIFNGMKMNGNNQEPLINYKEEEKDGKFLTYLDRPECQVKWGYLTIEALPL